MKHITVFIFLFKINGVSDETKNKNLKFGILNFILFKFLKKKTFNDEKICLFIIGLLSSISSKNVI